MVQDWRRDLKGFGNENRREIAGKQGEIGRERKLFQREKERDLDNGREKKQKSIDYRIGIFIFFVFGK